MDSDLVSRAKKILEKVNPDLLRRELRELEAQAQGEKFWKEHQLAAQKMRKLASIQGEIAKLERLKAWLYGGGEKESETQGVSREMPEKRREAGDEGAAVEELIIELETKLYLSGAYDSGGAIVSVHSGQGGVEAMDWAEMLYRMYSKYVNSRGWKLEEIDHEPGQEAGIKTVTFEVSGESAYGFLKYEAGVHRLVRQSPFNADRLRQTSFALVEVMPVIEENRIAGEQAMVLKDEDLEWEFFRSSSKGGQNVNKVSSAVRLKHEPTGIVVTSQRERDQSRNREIALKILKAKLVAAEEEKVREEEMKLRGKHVTPGWGNQIRSYVLSPYHLVKDLRTGYEETDSGAVLEGKLGGFVEAALRHFAKE